MTSDHLVLLACRVLLLFTLVAGTALTVAFFWLWARSVRRMLVAVALLAIASGAYIPIVRELERKECLEIAAMHADFAARHRRNAREGRATTTSLARGAAANPGSGYLSRSAAWRASNAAYHEKNAAISAEQAEVWSLRAANGQMRWWAFSYLTAFAGVLGFLSGIGLLARKAKVWWRAMQLDPPAADESPRSG